MRLSPHFSYAEMTVSQWAARRGIPNDPTVEQLINMVHHCNMMEDVRSACDDNVVLVSSSFRAPRVNKGVGGSTRSGHMEGLCSDFTIPGFGDVEDVIERIKAVGVNFRKVINEFGRWVHIESHPFNVGDESTHLLALRNPNTGRVEYRIAT